MSDIYLAFPAVPICQLEVKGHFDSLSEKERRYAHYLSRASWLGTRIVLRQVSWEAEKILDILLAMFPPSAHGQSGGGTAPGTLQQQLQTKATNVCSNEELELALQYFVQFLGNCGNYRSFGDTKFIPRIEKGETMTR